MQILPCPYNSIIKLCYFDLTFALLKLVFKKFYIEEMPSNEQNLEAEIVIF